MRIKIHDGEPTELCRIAFKYATDKCPQIAHHYTRYYYQAFKDRQQAVRNVFEMGIGYPELMTVSPNYKTGASLYMWREFFPLAHIHAGDNRPETIFQDNRIHTYLCDETKRSDLVKVIRRVGPDIDLFVDDASHRPQDQIFLCLNVLPLLSPDSIYVIEDLMDPDMVEKCLGDYDYDRIQFSHKRYTHERLIVIRNT